MATNRRTLKKEIRLICGALAAECIMAKYTLPGVDSKKFNDIVYEIADLQESTLSLIGVTFPRSASSFESRKEYSDERHRYFRASFAKLKHDFNKRVEKIVAEMNAALPDPAKACRKEQAAAE